MEVLEYMGENWSYILEKLWQHFYIFLISWTIAIIVGVLLGIFITRPGKEKAGKVVLSITGAAQAVPSIAVIALIFIFLGIGALPAIVALFIYSLVPIVFNAASGLLNVDPAVKESARGMGMSNSQILRKVELPLVIPTMFSGIRTAAVINIGTATIAATIGAGGLGEIILLGLRMMSYPKILAGAIPVTLLAIAVDITLAKIQKRIISPGLKILQEGRSF